MPAQICSKSLASLCYIFITFYTFQCYGVTSEIKQHCKSSVAVVDANSHSCREEKIATVTATPDLNKVLQNKINLVLHLNDSGPLQASKAAEHAEPQMIIGLPVKDAFDEFVKCGENGETYTGYCIDIFKAAIGTFGHNISYKFECFNGTYDELVLQVYYKKYDAAVGDITIMANRSNFVDFTQPYMESSLTMVTQVKVKKHTWLFVKPFTGKAWLLIFGGFAYTMIVVWLLERRSNPDFKGPWNYQLSTALWFTFSTLFFAHRESIRSNYTRAVMLVWFCAVFVVASSYQGNLTSILTVQNLKPRVTDIQQLKSSNATVGCDGNAFYRKYVHEALGFHPDKIISMTSNNDYIKSLQNGTISAAFLEVPYARILLYEDRKDYKDSGGQKDRFGGFGFAFPRGSPLAVNFSKAFLTLSEDGSLKKLDGKWFPPNTADSSSQSNIEEQRLDYDNFAGLFIVTAGTSTVILIYCIYRCLPDPQVEPAITEQSREANDALNLAGSRNFSHLLSSNTGSSNNYYTPEREMQEIHIEFPDNQTRPLRQATSFPGSDRRFSGVNSVIPSRQPIPHRASA